MFKPNICCPNAYINKALPYKNDLKSIIKIYVKILSNPILFQKQFIYVYGLAQILNIPKMFLKDAREARG
jgi:hypothetical protein